MKNNLTVRGRICQFFYTGFYSGYCPVAPGTAGTLCAWVLYILLFKFLGQSAPLLLPAAVFVLLYPAVLLGNCAEKHIGSKDPQVVVFDEMMGYWITMCFIPWSFTASVAGVVLFRFFDILKPWPIKGIQRLKGGLGIMIDDYIAGVFSNVLLWGLIFAARAGGVSFL